VLESLLDSEMVELKGGVELKYKVNLIVIHFYVLIRMLQQAILVNVFDFYNTFCDIKDSCTTKPCKTSFPVLLHW